jgi:hypothetical protein
MPPTQSTSGTKSSLAPLVVTIVLLAAAFAAGYMYASQLKFKEGYAAGVAARSAELRESIAKLLPPHPTTSQLNGTVSSVGADSLDLAVAQTIVNPLEPQAPLARKAMVSSTTKITLRSAKSAEEMQADQRDYDARVKKYNEALAKGATGLTVPLPPQPGFTDAPGKLSDIKAGMTVTVVAATDITTAASFDATEIFVMPAGGLPSGTPPVGAPTPTPSAPTPPPTASAPTAPGAPAPTPTK